MPDIMPILALIQESYWSTSTLIKGDFLGEILDLFIENSPSLFGIHLCVSFY